MADCKTMVRRKSRDSLFQPPGGGSTSQGTLTCNGNVVGCGSGGTTTLNSAGFSNNNNINNGCGCPSGNGSSRSKSYHHQHYHQHQHHNPHFNHSNYQYNSCYHHPPYQNGSYQGYSSSSPSQPTGQSNYHYTSNPGMFQQASHLSGPPPYLHPPQAPPIPIHQQNHPQPHQHPPPSSLPFSTGSLDNVNGNMPPHQHQQTSYHTHQPPSHHHHHPHHQQGPMSIVAQDPPPRPWIQLGHSKHKRTCFTVLCYNILCSRYATKTLYNYCPNWALDWNYRRRAILQELTHYSPDIISLQEMETDQFYNFFLPQLQLLGYSGIFAAKSRARTMVESKRKLVDGCAIFYRTNKFRLLSEHLIEFSQVAIANAAKCGGGQCSDEMLNRVQTKDNIALAALLETKMDSDQVRGFHGLVAQRPRPLLVCTCHIHWDPDFCDVKLVQTMMLMQELRKITDKLGIDGSSSAEPEEMQTALDKRCCSSSSSASSTSSVNTISTTNTTRASVSGGKSGCTLDKVNLLVCGDFNSLPQSGVVEFMQSGLISCAHPDFKGLNYNAYMKTGGSCCNCNNENKPPLPLTPPQSQGVDEEDLGGDFQHEFCLKSVYQPGTMPFTNYTLDFQGVIDYIFHSVKGLRPLGLLGPLDSSWLVQHNIVGAPHPCIPSDHLPLLVELEMIPAI